MPAQFPAPQTAGGLALDARSLVYAVDDRAIIDGVDLDLDPRTLTVILGPNGSGKSVLVRLLHGIVKPTSGTIHWGGLAMSEDITRRQALVFQRPVLLRRSVAANVDFVLRVTGRPDPEKRTRLLRRVALDDMHKHPARRLSGGEQQRLALARALATEPEVLFLDEPSASLDPASTQLIERLVLEERSKGTKIVFITHDLGQARRLADDVVFLYRGGVAEHTSADAFFASPRSDAAKAYLRGDIVI